MNRMTIHIEHRPLPTPDRRFDWSAITGDHEPGRPIGWGQTEVEAVDDLINHLICSGSMTGGRSRKEVGVELLRLADILVNLESFDGKFSIEDHHYIMVDLPEALRTLAKFYK